MYRKLFFKAFTVENGSFRRFIFSSRVSLFNISVNSHPLERYATSPVVLTSSDEAHSKPITYASRSKIFYLGYLTNNPSYKNLLIDPANVDFETEGRPGSLYLLKELVQNPGNGELIEKLKLALANEKEALSVDEICKIFFITCDPLNRNADYTSTKEIVSSLEEELLGRKLTRDEITKVLFALNRAWGSSKKFFFQKKMTVRFNSKIYTFSPQQAVVIFYTMFRQNESTLQSSTFGVLNYLSNNMSSFNGTELGIIARGLMKGNYGIYNKTFKESILKRAAEIVEDLNEVSIYFLCLLLKKFVRRYDKENVLDFQESFIPHMSKFDRFIWADILEIGVHLGYLNERLWEKVVDTLKKNINDSPYSKIRRMVSLLSDCGIQDEELLKLAIEKFENAIGGFQTEAEELYYKRNLVTLLNNLVHLRIYPKKLLDFLFAENFASNFKTQFSENLRAKCWEIKYCLETDKPEFKYDSFNEFSEKQAVRNYKMTKYIFYRGSTSLYFYKCLRKVQIILQNLYESEEKIFNCNWHPMHKRGIVMRFDKNLNAQPIPEEFKSYESLAKIPLKDGHTWFYFLLLASTDISNLTNEPKPRIQTVIRHLESVGYVPVVIRTAEIVSQQKLKTETAYLQNIISKHLQQISQQLVT